MLICIDNNICESMYIKHLKKTRRYNDLIMTNINNQNEKTRMCTSVYNIPPHKIYNRSHSWRVRHCEVIFLLFLLGSLYWVRMNVYQPIGLMSRVFANGPGDRDSIPGWVIPKTQKMVLDATLLNTQHYKVRIMVKVNQSWEQSSALPYTLVL